MVVVDNDLNLYDMEIYLLKIRGYKAWIEQPNKLLDRGKLAIEIYRPKLASWSMIGLVQSEHVL